MDDNATPLSDHGNNKMINPPVTDDEVGESSVSGTEPGERTSQVDKNYKETFGNNPKGETVAEEVDEDEKNLQEL